VTQAAALLFLPVILPTLLPIHSDWLLQQKTQKRCTYIGTAFNR